MSKPIIRGGCRRAYEATKHLWWFRIKDLIDYTGHPCDERKLRYLREDNPGLYLERKRVNDGHWWMEFKINPEWGKPQPGQTGMLDLDDIREGVRK